VKFYLRTGRGTGVSVGIVGGDRAAGRRDPGVREPWAAHRQGAARRVAGQHRRLPRAPRRRRPPRCV